MKLSKYRQPKCLLGMGYMRSVFLNFSLLLNTFQIIKTLFPVY
jgi:hypothetical protein